MLGAGALLITYVPALTTTLPRWFWLDLIALEEITDLTATSWTARLHQGKPI